MLKRNVVQIVNWLAELCIWIQRKTNIGNFKQSESKHNRGELSIKRGEIAVVLDGYEFSFTFITKISFKGAKPKIPLIRRFVVDNVGSGGLNRNLTDFALDKVSKCEGLQTEVGK